MVGAIRDRRPRGFDLVHFHVGAQRGPVPVSIQEALWMHSLLAHQER